MTWWESFTSFMSKVANQPIVISLSSIFAFFSGALLLFSRTSLGKKAINKAISLCSGADRKAAETLKKVQDIETLAKDKIAALQADYAKKVEELTNFYEQKLACALSFVNFYEESLFAIADQIPNVKVQALLSDYKKEYENKKKEIVDTIGVIYQDYTDVVKATNQELRKEYQSKIDFLENKVKEMGLFIEELKEGNSYGKGEETANSIPTEETL